LESAWRLILVESETSLFSLSLSTVQNDSDTPPAISIRVSSKENQTGVGDQKRGTSAVGNNTYCSLSRIRPGTPHANSRTWDTICARNVESNRTPVARLKVPFSSATTRRAIKYAGKFGSHFFPWPLSVSELVASLGAKDSMIQKMCTDHRFKSA